MGSKNFVQCLVSAIIVIMTMVLTNLENIDQFSLLDVTSKNYDYQKYV